MVLKLRAERDLQYLVLPIFFFCFFSSSLNFEARVVLLLASSYRINLFTCCSWIICCLRAAAVHFKIYDE